MTKDKISLLYLDGQEIRVIDNPEVQNKLMEFANSYHENQKLLAEKDERIEQIKSEAEILDIMIRELRELVNKQLDLHIEHCGIDARLQNVEGVNRTLQEKINKQTN